MKYENGLQRAGSGEPIEALRERFILYMEVVAMFHEMVNFIHEEIDRMEGKGKRRIVTTFGELIIREATEDMLQRLSFEKGGCRHKLQISGWIEDSMKGERDVE